MFKKPADIINSLSDSPDYKLVQEWIKYCIVEGLEEATLRGYRHNINNFIWWWHTSGNANKLGAHPENVSIREAREYAAYLRDPIENRWGIPDSKVTLSPATVANYSRPLKVWFNWLQSEGHISKSPFTRAVKFNTRKPDKVIKHVSVEDLGRIFEYLTKPEKLKTYVGCRDLAVITLFLDSGVRLGELLSIRIGDLDMTNMRFTIRGKTGQRYALFSERAKDAIKLYLKFRKEQDAAKDSALWFNVDGLPITHEGLVTSIRRVEQKSGVKFHPHKLRHTFALLMSRSVSVFELKELMGHSSITTTQIYVQQNIDLLGDRYRPNSPLVVLKEDLPGLQKRRRGRPKNSVNKS